MHLKSYTASELRDRGLLNYDTVTKYSGITQYLKPVTVIKKSLILHVRSSATDKRKTVRMFLVTEQLQEVTSPK